MRVNASGTEQMGAAVIQLPAQRQGMTAFVEAGAGQQHLLHACGIGTGEECFALFGKAWVGQIDADVDELHGATC